MSVEQKLPKPWNPYLVLAVSIVLPGVGQVLNGTPQRGLIFLFFIIVLAWTTSRISAPDATFLGRYAGGAFVYAVSILDAYRAARIKWELWRHAVEKSREDPSALPRK